MICQVIAELAILDVAMDVEGRNELLEVGKPINKIGKVLFKAIVEMNTVLTANVIAMENVAYFGVLSQRHRQGKISIRKPWKELFRQSAITIEKGLLFSLLQIDHAFDNPVSTRACNDASNLHTFEFHLILRIDDVEICASGFLTSHQ
jgi:hypothetical protein